MVRKILLVDDTETVLMFEKMMLKSTGHSIQTASNGRKAIEMVEKSPPDLILLDIMMPELNGIETCRQLKADRLTKDIPIVMVTTKGEPHMVEEAFKAGCNDFITKPVDKIELLGKVKTYLG